MHSKQIDRPTGFMMSSGLNSVFEDRNSFLGGSSCGKFGIIFGVAMDDGLAGTILMLVSQFAEDSGAIIS